MNPFVATDYKSSKVYSDLTRLLVAAGTHFAMIRCFKEPRHGKSPIDGQGGRFKSAMRYFERVNGSIFIKGIDHYINQSENGSNAQYDSAKGVYKVNFAAKDIVLNDGSQAYTPTAFKEMRLHQLVRDGVTYKCGVRDVHAIKVLLQPSESEIKSHIYALAFTPCPTACAVCYSGFNGFCDDVVQRQIEIPKERFVSVKKRNYQSDNSNLVTAGSPEKRRK